MSNKLERIREKLISTSRDEKLVRALIVGDEYVESKEGLEKGEEIKIPKFGNFVVKHKKSRPGRNPKTGEPYKISDRNVVSFKASKKLRESL